MMKREILILMSVVTLATTTQAASFDEIVYGTRCIKDDFSYAKSEWVTIDRDGDGLDEYYYFDENGFLVVNKVTPDGYKVNEKGQYVVDGVVQTKIKAGASNNIAENNANENNYIISKKQEETVKKQDLFVDNGDNTEGSENDPNTIQPKVRRAMNLVEDWCNEGGEIIIPYSKKQVKAMLQTSGFKKDTINRALSEVNINWSEHALIWARHLYRKGYVKDFIKEYMKEVDEFSNEEVKYAMMNLENNVSIRKYIEPLDYIGLNDEEKKAKLFSLGLNEDQVKQAMLFVENNK